MVRPMRSRKAMKTVKAIRAEDENVAVTVADRVAIRA
tara:strand:+ start:422 stop:532 length:111 start_codon:yes stop_codon:yes gene_type:complete